MGFSDSRSFTEAGVKSFYQYFILQILSALFAYIFFAVSYALPHILYFTDYFTASLIVKTIFASIYLLFGLISVWIVFSGMLRYAFLSILFTFYFIGIIFGAFLIAIDIFIIVIPLLVFLSGITSLLIGRKEFGDKHKSFAIPVFCFGLVYFILFFIYLVIAMIFGMSGSFVIANLSISLILYLSAALGIFVQSIIIILIIFITLTVMANLTFVFAIYYLTDKKELLWVAFILGILAPFTFAVTGIISLILFFIVYRSIYHKLCEQTVKPKLTVPCPFCNHDIPEESKFCPYCNRQFIKPQEKIEEPPSIRQDIPLRQCPYCLQDIPKFSESCPKCGKTFKSI